MRYQYIVILKKDSERLTDFLSILLCLFSIFTFLFKAVSSFSSEDGMRSALYGYLTGGTAVLLIAGVIVNFFTRRRRQVRYRYLLLIAGVCWLGMTGAPWIAAFFFLLAFLEFQAKRPLEIGFHHDRVVINTLFKRSHVWADFNNVMLKDGLLTLDFSNNKLFQKEVADEEDEDDAEEEEFNAFCREQLKKAT
jgi:hypothetical protein